MLTGRKSCYAGKQFSLFLLFIFISGNNIYSQGGTPDSIKNYPGIPIITYAYELLNYPASQFVEMQNAGIFALQAMNVTESKVQSQIRDQNLNLKVMPEQTDSSAQISNFIVKYTEGRYTEFEAEGTPEQDGLITLYSDSLAHLDKSNGAVSTTDSTPHGTMIYGPMYRQCRNYTVVEPDSIVYRAAYKLKIEDIDPWIGSSPDDTVCILQVTTSKTWRDEFITIGGKTYHTQPYVSLDSIEVLVVKDSVVTYKDFINSGGWQDFNLEYSFPIDFPWYKLDSPPHQIVQRNITTIDTAQMKSRISQNCVEFKVIWKGKNDKVKLSVDKVIVSDWRGRRLKDGFANSEIISQLNKGQTDFGNHLAGWIGLDEPWSLDMWEPIRVVSEILESHPSKRQLYFQFNVGGNGRFISALDPARGSQVIMIDEFMRRVKKANVWITGWLFDMPCDGSYPLAPCNQGLDFRILNINFMADSVYKRVTDAGQTYPGLHYGMSIQTGKYSYNPGHTIREISSNELLYTTNLALMYGSKLISPWLYFGYVHTDTVTNLTVEYTGFRNLQDDPQFEVTDKYNTLKDTIAPRLSGLLGKTLKALKPLLQFAGSRGIHFGPIHWDFNVNGYSYIEDIHPTDITPADNEYGLDIGFFTDPAQSEKRYFMVLNRSYSQVNRYTIKLKGLSAYINWNLFNYVDATSLTRRASDNSTWFADTLRRGDANLYSIHPVVKDGGQLLYNETITGTETLNKPMTIENGATLTVNGTYNSVADITLKAGGKIETINGGSINFSNGSKLIVDGSAQLNGTASNKLNLNFTTPIDNNGVVVTQNGALTMTHCNISNAVYGIKAETGANLVNVSYTNFYNCRDYGITLLGTSADDFETPQVQKIYNCNILGSLVGLNAVNYGEVVIKSNSFSNCNLGINLTQINSASIVSNTITGKPLPYGSSMPGILMTSSGGYLRMNSVKYHKFGVELAYTSIDMGLNVIEQNVVCGLLVGSGSYPDLVQKIVNPTCWYAIGGCNTIINNGIYYGPPPMTPESVTAGAEKYLSYGDVKLSYGGNEISDERTNVPDNYTIPLITGRRGSTLLTRELMADRNFWGNTMLTLERFPGLNVIYEPTGDYCPLPYSPCSGIGIIIHTSDGVAIDTIPTMQRSSSELTDLETKYSDADKLFYSGEFELAKNIYLQIAEGTFTSEEKLYAFNKLYDTGNLLKEDAAYFDALKTMFNNILSTETDTLLQKIYKQNSTLCDVSTGAYVNAISAFDYIIQLNPESRESFYAELDILATSLRIDTTGTQLGKTIDGRYLLKNSSDYLSKLKGLLTDKFGVNESTEEKIIPTEYSLYQNYPNPFNPTTTIKYDLPKDGMVELEIYDILGRRITKLVSEFKPAGSYEQILDASGLASGIYVYRLKAGDFIATKKMLMIK